MMTLIPALLRRLVIPAAAGVLLIPAVRAAPATGEKLMRGRYLELAPKAEAPAAPTGEWAFARFYLLPDRKTCEAAWKAQEKGDVLGKFIVMRAHQQGEGVKRDPRTAQRMNVELREALAPKKSPTAVESYILSHLTQADQEGVIDASAFPDQGDAYKVAGKRSSEHLRASAEGGFAQAMDEMGALEQSDDPESAMRWYRRAAEAGLAAGMKNLGFMLARGPAADPPEAIRWTRLGAEKGDIYAMMNMAAFQARLNLPGITEEEARQWVERAAATGHPMGLLEKGLALLMGNYGIKVDGKAGKALLQRAAASGSSSTLRQIAVFYLNGIGVDENCGKAAEFGRAAWRQGDTEAARILAQAYQKEPDLGGEKNEADYWKTTSMGDGSLAYAIGLDGKHPEILASLAKIDPFSLKID